MNEVSPKPNDSELTTSSEDDYNLIERALLQNPRGRWFLDEYINRQRPEDTKKLLSAIQRIENNLTTQTPAPEDDIDPIRMSIIEMSKAIAKTRQEIKSIKPANESEDQIINATGELSAIVESTETATNIILEAAEEIQEATWILREAGADEGPCGKIEERTTDIYTACSFQDITGQRTTKVVQALSYIESRVNAMIDIWGLNDMIEGEVPIEGEVDIRPDAHLLHGPTALGEGVEQVDIDDISFDSIDIAPAEAIDPNDMSFDAIEVVSDVDTAASENEEIASEVEEIASEVSVDEVPGAEVALNEVAMTEEAILQVPDETFAPEASDSMEMLIEPAAETSVDVTTEAAVEIAAEATEEAIADAPGDIDVDNLMATEAPEDSSMVDEIGEIDLPIVDDMNFEVSIDEGNTAVGDEDIDASIDFPEAENAAETLVSPLMESPDDMTGAVESEVATDETNALVDNNVDNGAINLGDIEVTDLDLGNTIDQSEDVIDPALDAGEMDVASGAQQEKEEELSMGEIETQVADIPDTMVGAPADSMATNIISSAEELEVIEELDVDALSEDQKDMILN